MFRKTYYLILLLIGAVHLTSAQQPAITDVHFPGEQWEVVDQPESRGLSSARFQEAKDYASTINTAAVMIVVDGKVAYQWGDVDKKYNTHSIRKSVLSALYGKYVRSGQIDLQATMADLGITDVEGLSEEELKATVADCLKARSGVYHPALYESAGMKRLKPARFSEKAGAHWYYNNWDFNVLGTIFEQQTKQKLFEAIERDIAQPIGMESYTAADGSYVGGAESIHKAYPFRVTAQDLARFGWLMLNNGNWNGTQVIDSAWVEESTRYHSDATLYSTSGYSYLWWVARNYTKYPHLKHAYVPEGSYAGRGSGGHVLMVIPAYNMVVVHRVNTDIRGNSVSYDDFGKLLHMILAARIAD